ncbi:uncharacterized protein LOC109805704 [Cajanus cajan]|uniref:uncharacterized protein LOC109805704 n=1 Tax=Cajanus cajan TaxID=3821 RepID=UPI00098DCC34|nr:uncharacterized protein LOC109805704 [Cajanus cajan]
MGRFISAGCRNFPSTGAPDRLGIIRKNLWRELKHRYNVTELEVPEPQEEDAPPLKSRKRKRGAKEVGGTSAPPDAKEVTSTAADASAVDLTESPPPKEAPQVAFEEVVRAAEVAILAAEQVAQAAEVAGDAAAAATQAAGRVAQAAEVAVPATKQVVLAAEARSEVPIAEVPIADLPNTEQETPASASVEARLGGPNREAPPSTAAASAPPSGSSQGASRS